MKDQHVFIKNESNSYLIWCANCGTEYRPAVPCEMGMFLDIIKSFGKSHKHCDKQVETDNATLRCDEKSRSEI